MNASELPRVRRRALSLGTVTLALLLGACASTQRNWRDLGARSVPFEDAWDAVAQTSARHGFPLAESESDRGRGQFKSRWRSVTQGFGQSRRRRVVAELTRTSEDAPVPGWQVRFHVEQQTVKDMARSQDPKEDDWSNDGQDTNLEDIMEVQLRLRFGDRPEQTTSPARR